MVAPIVPAVKSLSGNDDLVNRAVRANVERVVARLKGAKPIVAKAVAEGKVKVAGAVYDLGSGKVDFGLTA
jgi:carbonic anhydrase